MANSKTETPHPPLINPFVFPVVLAVLGLWCFYDGWFSTNPEIQEHLLFNRVLAGVLIPWATWDFFKTRKRVAEEKLEEAEQADDQ